MVNKVYLTVVSGVDKYYVEIKETVANFAATKALVDTIGDVSGLTNTTATYRTSNFSFVLLYETDKDNFSPLLQYCIDNSQNFDASSSITSDLNFQSWTGTDIKGYIKADTVTEFKATDLDTSFDIVIV